MSRKSEVEEGKSGSESNQSGQQDLDCLLVHAPKFHTYYPPFNVYQSCNRIAMGLLSLADLVDKKGHGVRVVHLGIERIRNKSFSFEKYLQDTRPKALGFSLHFHHSLVDTLHAVKQARKVLPEVFIFIGGFTATFFAEELMEKLSAVDVIIRGDAEIPLLMLLDKVKSGDSYDLTDVPNILWRKSGEISVNSQTHVISEDMLNELNFTRFDLMDHAEDYVSIPTAFVRSSLSAGFDRWMNNKMSKSRRAIFWGLPVGRGCVSHCFYCGGGAKAQALLNKRHGPVFRRPEKVIETIRGLKAFGYQGAYVSFDPHPWSQPYYVKLFQLMRKERLEFSIRFSSWGLPTKEFLDEFAKSVSPGSSFLISPETGSDRLRKDLRKPSYDNEMFLDFLSHAQKRGVKTTSYFSIGIPGEMEADFKETLALNRIIKEKYSLASTEAFLIEIEPASPWYMEPEKYGIKLRRKSFADFIMDQLEPDYSSMTSLGYTSDFFGDGDIEEREFSLRLDKLKRSHFDNNVLLSFMSFFWRVGRTFGLVPSPEQSVSPVNFEAEAKKVQ